MKRVLSAAFLSPLLLAGCTWLSVPGRFTLLDTKDNSVQLEYGKYDPATRTAELKGFALTNNASGPINAWLTGLARLLDQLDILTRRVEQLTPQPSPQTCPASPR